MFPSHRKRGITRLISAVAVLALIVAHAIGGYAHASGHTKAHSGVGHHHSVVEALLGSDEGPAGNAFEHPDDTNNQSESCDFMCNGGAAILISIADTHVQCPATYTERLSSFAHLAFPPSLERPPRSLVLA
jgi:hypothetical protein